MMENPQPLPALFEPFTLRGLSSIPLLGPPLATIFSQYILFYAVIPLGIAIYFVMTRTRTGLIVRALGDAPDACDAAGIPVRLWRTALLLFAGVCAATAGAFLSTMRGHSFQINMTGGQGFLVLALVIFGRWNILYFAAGTLAFGALDGLQSYLAAAPEATTRIPHQLFDMLPYAATLVALAVLTRSKNSPIHLGRPWPDN